MTHLIQYSSGITSWWAAKLAIDKYGRDSVHLLFADTLIEDEDNYRFLHESRRMLGVPMTVIMDSRTPWQVFKDVRFIGNSRVDPCSRILKRDLIRSWIERNYHPETVTLHVGLNFDEPERLTRLQERGQPWRYASLLMDRPWHTKAMILKEAESVGLRPPRLYAMGFDHANCGGFCVKAGQNQFRRLLIHFPERYQFHEEKEQEVMSYLGTDSTVLRDRRGGEIKPLSLRDFRKRIENREQVDMFDYGVGTCGCAIL